MSAEICRTTMITGNLAWGGEVVERLLFHHLPSPLPLR
jgi:hypothetical protein